MKVKNTGEDDSIMTPIKQGWLRSYVHDNFAEAHVFRRIIFKDMLDKKDLTNNVILAYLHYHGNLPRILR